jgi:hypothetical protein
MKNITEIITELIVIKQKYHEDAAVIQECVERLQKVDVPNVSVVTPEIQGMLNVVKSRTIDTSIKEQLKDYPYQGKFSQKLQYISKTLNRPLRSREFLELFEIMEGKERRIEYDKQISSTFSYLMKNLKYVAQKYGNNTYTFYFLSEWVSWDGDNGKEKLGYEIKSEDFERGGIPDYKRLKFTWLPKKIEVDRTKN